ncbi:hypothetical protein IMZ48_50005 [Candidatus Bathyarchaeota archaeon]|nr:hypothetical protein [Candidatus Bathyarchaeota archaeon]
MPIPKYAGAELTSLSSLLVFQLASWQLDPPPGDYTLVSNTMATITISWTRPTRPSSTTSPVLKHAVLNRMLPTKAANPPPPSRSTLDRVAASHGGPLVCVRAPSRGEIRWSRDGRVEMGRRASGRDEMASRF